MNQAGSVLRAPADQGGPGGERVPEAPAAFSRKVIGLRGRPGLIWALACVASAAACLVLAAVLLDRSPRWSDITYLAVMGSIGTISLAASVIVGARRPHNIVGPLLGFQGVVPCLIALTDTYNSVYARIPGRLPVSPWVLAFTQGAWMLWYLPPTLLLLFFPEGRLRPGRRWRIAVGALLAVPIAFCVSAAFTTTTFDPPYRDVRAPLSEPHGGWLAFVVGVEVVCLLGLLALLFIGLAAVVLRFRGSTGIERAQLKWFLLGATWVPVTLLLCWFSYLVLGTADLVVVGLIGIFVSIPVATGIALLRHDLYDVDRALAAATTYGLVSALLLATFTIASFLGGLGLGHRSPVVAAAATALCAAGLSPLRTRLRHGVDKRLYPTRQRALEAIERLRADTHAGRARPEQLGAVLARALGDPTLRIGYRPPGSAIDVDADGQGFPELAPSDQVVPVILGDEPVGVLIAGPALSRALLREVGTAAALLFEVVRLRAGLNLALLDVESSRTRLLQAGYDERRRLERDLHDGAQQRLVTLGMALRLAQRHLDDGTVELDDLIEDAVDQLGSAVAELRQIAHGLRPSSLDDGLGSALTTLIERLPVPVALEMTHGPVPEAVATTAYYVAAEAVANAVKHSDAERIALDIRHLDNALSVRISDNGQGGAQVRPGAGLAGLSDRVAAAGGALRVDSAVGFGTVVEAVLPCAS